MQPSNGETYFFRDHGQFDLLRLRLLPELIERGRAKRTLRLWSAGCSSGEEAYSMAILVDMLLPKRDGWNITIIGNDIDPTALSKARQACYGQWSFRMVPPALQQRYFRRQGNMWELDESIRRMVRFLPLDLIGAPFIADELREMDLILCRNVFIYFTADAVNTVAHRLAAALCEGGYLMTGHAELIGYAIPSLQSILFTEGVVYQRITLRMTGSDNAVQAACPDHVVSHPATTQHQSCVPPSASTPVAQNAEDLLAMAHDLADRGDYARADQVCHQILGGAPLAPEPHFLLAQLAQLRGDFVQAEVLLNKTLYLDPQYVPAYLELAALCERSDNLPRAQGLRRAALDIVRALPGDVLIEPYETTAAEMAQWLAQ